jgi:hypothetical protein
MRTIFLWEYFHLESGWRQRTVLQYGYWETGCEAEKWTELAQDRAQWRNLLL